MQISRIFTCLALAMNTGALPAAEGKDLMAPRQENGTCRQNQSLFCCAPPDFNCTPYVDGQECDGLVICCRNNYAPVSRPDGAAETNSVLKGAGI
ncbi:hypothetical protein NEMBOFW57_009062 [Staphylotrichum longicolle]|uniref:Uncharacterized protein n=1 Tax=Staphylotrichum longicolle TaxID=669026 RepID=A0AAD4EWR8_9PEZI|nr:hypothetical protein NEMBOFW57_009062 [Staphylotrichum longicolle]